MRSIKFRIVWAPAVYVISDTYDVNCMSAGGADQDGRGNEEFERLSRTNGSGCTLRGPEAPAILVSMPKVLMRKGGLEPPQGEPHKIPNLRDLYRAKSSEAPTTNGRGFAPLRAPLTTGFTVRTAIEPHPSQSTQFNQSL